ncbi:MAG: DUF6206 family protein [Acidimicrobiales bacterium]
MSDPDVIPASPDLAAVEAAIRSAVDRRRPDELDLIGNGEFSIAVHWRCDGTHWVMKRVPPFRSRAAADGYIALTRDYIATLRARGVRCVATDLAALTRPDGRTVVYHVQPLLDVEQLADQVLARDEPDPEHPLAVAVVDTVVAALRGPDGSGVNGVGLDAQFANWYHHDGEPWQLDFSTPLLLDPAGRIRFEAWGFLQEYPLPLRPLVYREVTALAPRYLDTGYVLTDVLVGLIRQDLDAWCEPVVRIARHRHGIEISPAEAAEHYREEAQLFPRLLKLKRLQRAWIQRTGRRYDSLLPTASSFG